ncbi:GATOR2 complex protein MIOS-A-like [Liolophura sinensis]|uniref:GATOR2 complex protein MIOS-A-like n=1 Tax=Liolophura sinensis TaxID=3198878 RepID=UPI0031595E2E
MTTGTKGEVHWSPVHDGQFVINHGSNISLYKVEKNKTSQNCIKLSTDRWATQLAVSSDDLQYMKCLAWRPLNSPDNIIAVGQANGRVLLTSFGNKTNDLVGKEFAPRHSRQCSYLAWNPLEPNLLAEGFERYKNDHCIAIWDVTAKPYTNEMPATPDRQRVSLSESGVICRPHTELGPGEGSSSFSWFTSTNKCFVTGINGKNLRIYDLRAGMETSRAQKVAMTKLVWGVCVDPQCDKRVASFFENVVAVWDTRNFDRPLVTLPQEMKPVLRIDWCPTRLGLLTTLTKESGVIKLHDIRHSSVGTDEPEPNIMERFIQPLAHENITSYSWNPKLENRLLVATPRGNLKETTVYERIALSWSAEDHVTWSCSRKTIDCSYNGKLESADISLKIRHRALSGYGLRMEQLWENAELMENEPNLKTLWMWLDSVKSLIEENKKHSQVKNGISKFVGVQHVLRGDKSELDGDSSTEHYKHFTDLEHSSPLRMYQSDVRSRALQLCGWTTEGLGSKLHSLKEDGWYERAAALALFNLDLNTTLGILSHGAEVSRASDSTSASTLNAVAMALSGYTEDPAALWQRMCMGLCRQLTDPYLRAMFAFLTGERLDYEDVLNEDGMQIQDRVAFACIFLSDIKLADYIDRLTARLTEEGDLGGILLTGLTTEGVTLLEKYVDNTGDVQSAALACISTFPSEIAKDKRVQAWIDNYCNLLDRWRLWHQRAELDNLRYCNSGLSGLSQPPSQVYVSCNFCGKSISSNNPVRQRPFPGLYGSQQTKSRISSCPGCRKPLPRCALCLMHMGTASGTQRQNQPNKTDNLPAKLTLFNTWFTWCQTCRHGGHASHILEWFRDNMECPVTGCNCKCMMLDSIGRLMNEAHS